MFSGNHLSDDSVKLINSSGETPGRAGLGQVYLHSALVLDHGSTVQEAFGLSLPCPGLPMRRTYTGRPASVHIEMFLSEVSLIVDQQNNGKI